MRYEKSCGAVLFTPIDGQRHYVLVRTKDESAYGLPKGHMEGEESEEQTALREILEETCVHAELLQGFREQIEYVLPNGALKRVVYFIARFDNQTAHDNPLEALGVVTLPYTEALQTLTHENVKQILTQAEAWLSSRT